MNRAQPSFSALPILCALVPDRLDKGHAPALRLHDAARRLFVRRAAFRLVLHDQPVKFALAEAVWLSP